LILTSSNRQIRFAAAADSSTKEDARCASTKGISTGQLASQLIYVKLSFMIALYISVPLAREI